jgi:hypothetical protein
MLIISGSSPDQCLPLCAELRSTIESQPSYEEVPVFGSSLLLSFRLDRPNRHGGLDQSTQGLHKHLSV